MSNLSMNETRLKSKTVMLSIAIFLITVSGLSEAVVTHDVDYISEADYKDGKDRLDIYMPEGAETVPVIVFFHGGALRMGSKADAKVVASRFVPKGIAVVSVNYRLSPGVMHPAHIEDAAAATAWVIKNIRQYGGDPDKVYVAGHSAGAYLAALLVLDPHHLGAHGLQPEAIRAAIPISPFLYVEETAAVRPKDVWGKDPVNWLAASVTPHIKPGKRPMLLIYADGDADWRKRQNDTFGLAMRGVGNNAIDVVEVPHRDHMTLMSEMNTADDQIGELLITFIKEQE
ncbi:MAG: acetyl esterase/lipase [Planctomycetota bacterium]|jgi:acetyl esterase/lipase